MTKVSVFGQSEVKETEKKKIELVLMSTTRHEVWTKEHCCEAKKYKEVVLLSKNYDKDYDLIFGRDINNKGFDGVFLGHWNDGVV